MGYIPTITLLNDYERYTQDTSSTNVDNGKRAINHYYAFLYAEADNYVDERTKYTDLKANQRSYLLPPDYYRMKRVRVKANSLWYNLRRVTNMDEWAEYTYRNIVGPIAYAYTLFNEQGNMHLELDIVPSADVSSGLEMVYEGYLNALSFPNLYTTGTVTVTHGSYTVTGSSTSWLSAGNLVGLSIQLAGSTTWYEIASVVNDTTLTLVQNFQEATATGVGYQIAELTRMPREFDYTPVWAAVADYWMPSNLQHAAPYSQKYQAELQFLTQKYKSKTTGSVTPGKRVAPLEPSWPRNYPRTRIG